MTIEELENNYEFKVIKRALKQDFPFIIDIVVNDEAINKFTLGMYAELIIDPYMIGQMYGLTVWSPVTRALKNGEDYWSPYLSTLFVSYDKNHKDTLSITSPIHRLMDKMMEGIHMSRALPDEYKLPKKLLAGSFRATPSSLPPDITSIPN
jgi:hypothetical protein